MQQKNKNNNINKINKDKYIHGFQQKDKQIKQINQIKQVKQTHQTSSNTTNINQINQINQKKCKQSRKKTFFLKLKHQKPPNISKHHQTYQTMPRPLIALSRHQWWNLWCARPSGCWQFQTLPPWISLPQIVQKTMTDQKDWPKDTEITDDVHGSSRLGRLSSNMETHAWSMSSMSSYVKLGTGQWDLMGIDGTCVNKIYWYLLMI